MCDIDDRVTGTWSQEEFEREYPEVKQARLKYERHCLNMGWEPYQGFDEKKHIEESEFEEATMLAYLDGLIALPSETERILAEMEQEKRGEI